MKHQGYDSVIDVYCLYLNKLKLKERRFSLKKQDKIDYNLKHKELKMEAKAREPLWNPSAKVKEDSNMSKFLEYVNKRFVQAFMTYQELYKWSINEPEQFWAAAWEFCKIDFSEPFTAVVENQAVWPGTRWFPGAKLNVAENLLNGDRPDWQEALVFISENGKRRAFKNGELKTAVGHIYQALKGMGVKKGDRVAAYIPNIPEAAIAMMATLALGAVWSSCSMDLGPKAALDRLGQVKPKVLFVANGYLYKGKTIDRMEDVAEITAGLPSLEKVVVYNLLEEITDDWNSPDIGVISNAVHYKDFYSDGSAGCGVIDFEQVGFDHPCLIIYTSGTTGEPKCMVQGAGVLLNHLKELRIHSDLKSGDKIFYITTTAWMMWNWLLSSLAVGATAYLHDGFAMHPDNGALWKMVDEEKINVFGLSAGYIEALMARGYNPKDHFKLEALRQISQTGSALSVAGFEWVYANVKADLHLNSISGGSDINGCFAMGSPFQPVYAGELQGPALGMDIACYNDRGEPVTGEKGQLICRRSSPSMPLYFLGDEGGLRYLDAYFRKTPGKMVWCHGDFILIHSDTGGITFYGRSDSVLNVQGVRIGPAEFYSVLEQVPEVVDALVIEQKHKGSGRAVLFVQLAEGLKFTDELQQKIRTTLRDKGSFRLSQVVMMECPEIPYTSSGKKVESAVTAILNGIEVTNRGALKNPGSLDFFIEALKSLQ